MANAQIDAPGLQPRARKDGVAWYWVASRVSRKAAGFTPKTVRLHGDEDARAARCRVLTAELRAWLAGKDKGPAYDGTLASLIRCYQHDEESPYRTVKAATRQEYDYCLGIIQVDVGPRRIASITGKDIRRWHRNWQEPAEPGGERRERRAWGCAKLLRTIANYGTSEALEGCAQFAAILSKLRFPQPVRREEALSYDHAAAIVRLALDQGEIGMALGQALQFETTLRQIDVIGYWEPSEESGGITFNGRRWAGGVLWSDVSEDLVLRKKTTKTGATGAWDLKLCPLVMLVLPQIPQENRVGPMVVSSRARRPYLDDNYSRRWRKLADACGVPKTVWNRDSRAGGITEGFEAGADPRDVQSLATHSDGKMTSRYNRGTTLRQTSNVAELRAKARKD